jgi:hypothetical protein
MRRIRFELLMPMSAQRQLDLPVRKHIRDPKFRPLPAL